MKQILLLQTLVLLVSISFSQAYHPIIEPDKYWNEGTFIMQNPCYTTASRFEFTDDDTLVNGNLYRICNSYILYGEPGTGGTICPPFASDTIPIRQVGLREDTVAKKVYAYVPSFNPTDVLIYDFSLSVGDTLFYSNTGGEYQVLNDIEEIILLNGETRRKFWFDNYSSYYIEGIGGKNGLFNPILLMVGGGTTTFCVKQDGVNIIGDQCNTYFVGRNTYQINEPSIAPNPVKDILEVMLTTFQQPVSFEMYDLQGVKVLSQVLTERRNTLDMSQLRPGFYVYIISSNSTVYQGKLIKI